MESPSYEEKNMLEDEEKNMLEDEEKNMVEDEEIVTQLVPYSSSEDEDESHWLHGSGPDTLLKAKCSSNLDAEEEEKTEASEQSETDFDDTFSDHGSDDSDCEYQTDRELLRCGPYSWRRADRSNQKEAYVITVDGESPRKESRCLELLNAIGCSEKRFLGCSVEMLRCFFANLNKNEAARIKGVEGVCSVTALRRCFGDI